MGEGVRSVREGTRGFAAVDALVALAILASTIALALQALASARHVAVAAAETQRAQVLLRYLLAPLRVSRASEAGSRSGFNWRTGTIYLPADGGAPGLTLCRRWAGATSARSGRRYALATAGFCRRPRAES